MAQIHEFSVVDPNAQLADDVVVGPFCVIGPNVKIGAGTVLKSHVNIHGDTVIGERNVIYPNASIGCDPQDKKYAGEPTKLVIGDDNVIREHVTISIGTVQDEGITIVGNRNLFMANAHVAHDCVSVTTRFWPITWLWLVTRFWAIVPLWAVKLPSTNSVVSVNWPWWAVVASA